MAQTMDNVPLPLKIRPPSNSDSDKCLGVVQFSNGTSTVFSIWFFGSGTTFWFEPRLGSMSSTIPYVCWHSNICPVWIRSPDVPIVLHYRLGGAFDRRPVSGSVYLTALDLKEIQKKRCVNFYTLLGINRQIMKSMHMPMHFCVYLLNWKITSGFITL